MNNVNKGNFLTTKNKKENNYPFFEIFPLFVRFELFQNF